MADPAFIPGPSGGPDQQIPRPGQMPAVPPAPNAFQDFLSKLYATATDTNYKSPSYLAGKEAGDALKSGHIGDLLSGIPGSAFNALTFGSSPTIQSYVAQLAKGLTSDDDAKI